MPLDPQQEFELLSLEREKALAAPPETPKPQQEFGANTDTLKALMQYTPVGIGYKVNEKLNEALGKAAYSAGGAVTDITGSPAAGTAANIAVQTLPAMLPGGAVVKGAAKGFEGAAKWLMQSAMKPTATDLLSGKAQAASQTLLERGISPTNEGMMRLKKLGEDLNTAVADLIAKSGGTVNKGEAASGIQKVISRIETTNPAPNQARSAAENYYNEFLKNKLVPENMPVEQAQALKQGLYKILKDQYGTLSLAGQAEGQAAKTLSQKALASGLKEKIESVLPGVKPLNEEASKIWNALNVSERKALMEANKDPMGMALLPHNPIAMLSFWANRSAAFKSGLAKILYSGQEQIPATAARAGIGAVEVSQTP